MKYLILLCLLVFNSFDSNGQYYSQIIQTPLVLHPAYAGRDTLSFAIVGQTIFDRNSSQYKSDRYQNHDDVRNLLFTADGKISNAWNWGVVLNMEDNLFKNTYYTDSSFFNTRDISNNRITEKKIAVSAFAGYNWTRKEGKYVWTNSFGIDYSNSKNTFYHMGQGLNRNVTAGQNALNSYSHNQNSYLINIPLLWTSIGLRTQRVFFGAKAGVGRRMRQADLNDQYYSANTDYNRNFIGTTNVEITYMHLQIVGEAVFPKNPNSFFSFRPVIALGHAIDLQNKRYSWNNFTTSNPFILNHVSANFRIGKFPFGVGSTNTYANAYVGYNFKKASITAGVGDRNVSLGLRCSF